MRLITAFPEQFWLQPRVIVIKQKIVLLQNPEACNFIKKRLQHRSFSGKLAGFLRASVLKNICKQLLPKTSTLQTKLFIYSFHKDMTSQLLLTFKALKFLLCFCADIVFAKLFYKSIF